LTDEENMMTTGMLTLAIGLAALFTAIMAIMQGFILAGQKKIQCDINDLWKRVNAHGHVIHCPNRECLSPETGSVVITGGN
jgi:hypothetical protein